MDTITYDFSRLDHEEMLELRALQGKMRRATGSIEGYSALTVDELLRLEDLHYRMAGKPNPHKRTAGTLLVSCALEENHDSHFLNDAASGCLSARPMQKTIAPINIRMLTSKE